MRFGSFSILNPDGSIVLLVMERQICQLLIEAENTGVGWASDSVKRIGESRRNFLRAKARSSFALNVGAEAPTPLNKIRNRWGVSTQYLG